MAAPRPGGSQDPPLSHALGFCLGPVTSKVMELTEAFHLPCWKK